MFSDQTIRAVRAAGAAESLDADERAELRRVLLPLLVNAAHGMAVARDALGGPDPEMAAMYLHDTLVSLAGGLARSSRSLPS